MQRQQACQLEKSGAKPAHWTAVPPPAALSAQTSAGTKKPPCAGVLHDDAPPPAASDMPVCVMPAPWLGRWSSGEERHPF